MRTEKTLLALELGMDSSSIMSEGSMSLNQALGISDGFNLGENDTLRMFERGARSKEEK